LFNSFAERRYVSLSAIKEDLKKGKIKPYSYTVCDNLYEQAKEIQFYRV
jgi:hypothetical protein